MITTNLRREIQEELEEKPCTKGSSEWSEDAILIILKREEPLFPGGEKDETIYSPP